MLMILVVVAGEYVGDGGDGCDSVDGEDSCGDDISGGDCCGGISGGGGDSGKESEDCGVSDGDSIVVIVLGTIDDNMNT